MASISYRNRNKGKLDSDGRAKKANWEYRFFGASINGVVQRFEKSGFRTKDDAIKAGTQAFNEYMNGGSVFVASDVSYSDCLDSWMENYVAIQYVNESFGDVRTGDARILNVSRANRRCFNL